jgi:hypothetical protein
VPPPEPTVDALAEEARRGRRLRVMVDLATELLRQGHVTRQEAEAVVAAVRQQALALFPGKESTFDLVLAPRFARLVDEFAVPPRQRKILPFPPR